MIIEGYGTYSFESNDVSVKAYENIIHPVKVAINLVSLRK